MSYSHDPELDAQRHTDQLAQADEEQMLATQAFKRAFHTAAAKNDSMTTVLGCIENGQRQPLYKTVQHMLDCPFISKKVVEYILGKAKEDREAWLIVDDWATRYAVIESGS